MNPDISKYLHKKSAFRFAIVIALIIVGSWLIAASVNQYNLFSDKETDLTDTLIIRSVKSNDSLYKAYSRKGDNLNSAKNYQQALDEYEKALKIRPNDAYVTDKVNKIKIILTAQSKSNIEYTKAIGSGDNYFKEKDYLNAKSAYQIALDMNPDDPYAKGKLQETMDLLRSQKAVNILYDVAIASAEKLFQAKDYEKAIAEFENAAKILPGEKYPKDRINEIIKIMVDQKTKEEMYTRSITAADKFYTAKSYQNALLEYQNASSYKPDEQYPKDRIKELTALLASLKSTEEAYKKAIASADKLFNDASYVESRVEYQNASKIKPQEIYPVKRIKEIDDLLANLKRTKEQYEHMIAIADSLYIGQKFVNARLNYQQALKVRPKEAYPKEMIAKTEKMMSEQDLSVKQVDIEYQDAINKADGLVTGKSYEPAKKEYQHALTIKPDEQYPKDRINEIVAILAGMEKQKSLDDQYISLIAGADKLLADKSYGPAKVDYQKALQIKPSEQYPKDKISLIDAALADLGKQKALDDQYTTSISKADKLLAVKSWEPAKIEYTAASNLKPSETYPKDKIAEIEKVLTDLAKQKAADENYQTILANADKLLLTKSYNDAKTEYGKASDLKPAEQYPKTKISEIDKILASQAEQQQKDEQFTTAIARADKLLTEKSYDVARTEYQNASLIKPAETYPKTKITEIEKILADLGKQKLLDERYQAAIASGDKLLDEKSYADAKTQYQTASSLKPAEQYPKDKISLIDIALADLSKQKALDDQYTASILKADKLLAAKSWEPAKVEYTAASNLKPSETYPKEKIAEIEKVLTDLAKQKAADENYQTILTNADKLLLAKSYNEAKVEYAKASDLKPAEQYPKTTISEIDKILTSQAEQQLKDEQYKTSVARADQLLAEKSYEQAKSEYLNASSIKPAEAYPKAKITEIDKILAENARLKLLDEQYSAVLADADKLLLNKSYIEAKTKYNAALIIKPNEQYPKEKISEIDKTIAELEKKKELDDQYAASIIKADKLLTEKNYDLAKAEYTNSLKLKPEEKYPKDKLIEIDKLQADIIAQKTTDEKYRQIISKADNLLSLKSYDPAKTEYSNALVLKPAEQYPKDKIDEIDKAIADIAHKNEIESKYKISILKADQLFLTKAYQEAKAEYIISGSLKPVDEYPKTKIAAIDKIMADLKSLDDQYTASIAKADQLLIQKSYDPAKSEFLNASRLKPGEQYPKDKLAEIDKTLTELAKQKALDNQYQTILTKADKLLAEKSYILAKTEYANAGGIKPSEQYPKDRISEIDGILEEMKAKDDAYKVSISKANLLLTQKSYNDARNEYQNASSIKPNEQFPKDKIAEINKLLTDIKGKKQTYDELIVKGNDYFGQRDYYKAKETYQQAIVIFPEEAYPKERLTRITNVIDSIYRANKGLYDKAIADGDKFYTSMIYDKAIDSYTEALSFLPMENYPREMLSKIKKIISENAIVDVLKTTIVIPKDIDKQFPFTPVNMASRRNNYVYVKIRNLSDKPFNVLIRYGKDKQSNGGAVIKNLAPDGKISDRLISVRDQDPWYREDNNWVSLYPQGGDVEVTFIQISRATQ